MTCWEWKGNARDEGEAAARWVSELLGEPSRLVRFIGEAVRSTARSPRLTVAAAVCSCAAGIVR